MCFQSLVLLLLFFSFTVVNCTTKSEKPQKQLPLALNLRFTPLHLIGFFLLATQALHSKNNPTVSVFVSNHSASANRIYKLTELLRARSLVDNCV